MLRKAKIEVEDFGPVRAIEGEMFLEALNRADIDLHNDCGGNLKCGKCRIIFLAASPDPLEGDRHHLGEEDLARGMRLACIHQVRGDCRLRVPEPEIHELLESGGAELLEAGELEFLESGPGIEGQERDPTLDLQVKPAAEVQSEEEIAELDDLH